MESASGRVRVLAKFWNERVAAFSPWSVVRTGSFGRDVGQPGRNVAKSWRVSRGRATWYATRPDSRCAGRYCAATASIASDGCLGR